MTTSTPSDTTPGGPDALATLTALRPDTRRMQGWSAQEQAATRERIMATDATLEDAAHRAARPVLPVAGRRKHAAAVALGALVVVSGAGAAAAGGLVPQAFVDAFTHWRTWPGDHRVDPATAVRIATAPGPDGTVFTLVAAHADDDPDHQCLVTLYETQQSTRQPGPAVFQDVSGNWCQDGSTDEPFGATTAVDVASGAGYSRVGVTGDTWVWSTSTGSAASARLRTTDGQTYPVLTYEGRFFGWFPAPEDGQDRPVLTGYDADGTPIGQTSL
jgi:hypothetical protein